MQHFRMLGAFEASISGSRRSVGGLVAWSEQNTGEGQGGGRMVVASLFMFQFGPETGVGGQVFVGRFQPNELVVVVADN